MTKMQILAKTALTVIGIHAIVLLLRNTGMTFYRPAPWFLHAIHFMLLIALIFILARVLIFKNDSIARSITGPGKKLSPNKAAAFLACSYRVALVFYGLTLLNSSARQFQNLITVFNPVLIRKWINNTLYAGFDFIEFCVGLKGFLLSLFLVVLMVYLIVGAPHFVRMQAKRLSSQTRNQ